MSDNVVDILVKTTNEASSGFQSIVSDITGLSGKAIETLGGIGTAAAASVIAIAGLGVAAFAIGDAFSQSYDKIRVGTGETGDALDALKGDFKTVVSDVPADFGSASEAITKLHQTLGLSGPALDKLSEQFLNLARITGGSVNETVAAGTKVFQNWNVAAQDQGDTLDFLFRTTQQTGIGFNQLASEVADNGVKMRALGFSLEDTAALFGGLSKAGIDASAVMPAFSKELANSMKNGKDAKEVLADFFAEVKRAPEAMQTGQDAVKLFGARAGPQLVDAIKEGKLSVGDLENSIATGSDTINKAAADTEHFGEKLTILKNRLLVLAEPVAIKVFDGVSNAIDFIVQKAQQLGTLLGPALHTMGDAVATVAVPAWNMLQDVVGKVVGWLQANVPTILDKIGGAFETLRNALNPLISFIQSHQEVFERLGQGLAIVAAVIGGVLLAALAAAAAAVLVFVAAIATIAVVIGAAIAVIFQIGQVLWDVFQDAKDAVATAGGAITSFFANLGQAALTVVHAIGSAFAAIPGVIASVAGAIGGAISAIVSFFVALPGRIISVLVALPGQLANLFSEGMHAILFAIGFAAGTIVSVVVNMVLGIVHAAQALPGQLVNIFNSAKDMVVNVVTTLVTSVVSFFQQLPGRVLGAIIAIHAVIHDTFWAAKDMAVSVVTATVNAVADFFAQLPGRAASVLSSLWSAISGAFSSARDGATSAATSIVDSVTNFLASLPGRAASALSGFAGAVTSALSSAVSAATSIGSDIVRGVASGITSGVGWVIDAAKSAASSIMDGFKSALHIGSPSRRTGDEIGVPMAQGIGVGIEDATPALQNTVTGVVGKVVASASAAVTRAGGGLAAAAAELMRNVSGGTFIEEDMSFRGMSSNYQRYQSQLADMFWSQNAGRNFGTGTWERGAEMAFAQGVANQVTFNGNTSDALATVIMQLIRTGKIQIGTAAF